MQKKIRVMLVDDEYLAIEDLKTLIDWNALGFEICAAACSGRQALHACGSGHYGYQYAWNEWYYSRRTIETEKFKAAFPSINGLRGN